MSLQETNKKQIEVEFQFEANRSALNNINNKATLIKEQRLDEYIYDTDDYKLFLNDSGLRKRNGNYEFKIRKREQQTNQVEVYEEYSGEAEIMKFLAPTKSNSSIEEILVKNGFKEIIHIISTRKKYQYKKFTIDIDETDFGYNVVEIELLVSTYDQVEPAKQQILDFAEELGLSHNNARSKLKEYIVRFLPDLAATLRAKHIIN